MPKQKYNFIYGIIGLVKYVWFEVIVCSGGSVLEGPDGLPELFPVHLVGPFYWNVWQLYGGPCGLGVAPIPDFFPYLPLLVGMGLVRCCLCAFIGDDLGRRNGFCFLASLCSICLPFSLTATLMNLR